jgi:hypothetical protein
LVAAACDLEGGTLEMYLHKAEAVIDLIGGHKPNTSHLYASIL